MVPVTDPMVKVKTFKITLEARKRRAAQNTAELDGNTKPEKPGAAATGTNGQGPSLDDFVVEYKDGARVH